MKDVQLLVVNKSGLQCGVGEVGEIYVRSGGLAEGYLELEEVTASKFLENPFRNGVPLISNRKLSHYKGPRDRIYRTGDLGRYQPNGYVYSSPCKFILFFYFLEKLSVLVELMVYI